MNIALTTRWNAHRHTDGAALIDEILELGFERVELGYDTRSDLLPGICRRVEEGAVRVDSLHNFCPVPPGSIRAHPETYTFADPDPAIRAKAVAHTARTLECAVSVGARVVVSHCGNVIMRRESRGLLRQAERGRRNTAGYQRRLNRLRDRREAKAGRQFPLLAASLEQLLPALEETGVQLALENLPSWEAFPTELELERLFDRFGSTHLRYWHDFGHGQIRENLGLINVERWLDRLAPHLAGMHLHDVIPPGRDHVMPPRGDIDFSRFARFGRMDVLRVLEPRPGTPAPQIVEAKQWVEATWAPRLPDAPGSVPTSKETAK